MNHEEFRRRAVAYLAQAMAAVGKGDRAGALEALAQVVNALECMKQYPYR